jgi:hypothetical protein
MITTKQLNSMGFCKNCGAKCCRSVSLDNLTKKQIHNFKKKGVEISKHKIFGWMAHLNDDGCPEIGEFGECKIHGTDLQPQTCKNLATGSEYCRKIKSKCQSSTLTSTII